MEGGGSQHYNDMKNTLLLALIFLMTTCIPDNVKEKMNDV